MGAENYQNFIIGKGDKVVDGESHHNDFVHVIIEDHDKALDLAMNILNAVHSQRYEVESRKSPITFNLTGTLESEADDE
ncbi:MULTISPECIES: hypothetical protein [Vibrio]|uniref:Uncharacterized protein n=1 Tax=Vibrio vulnificus TaxID=672 RepID=A0A2S3R1E5_VIBVL|nr:MULTISPECIES: hypothetical protein [Vibrio]MCZ2801986.1 hypothetical protein [Vibrio alginolyticus]PAW02213.1 hypothetical protein CKJ79_16255 [Vibrio coralliilyticus]POB46930.1 hypothetical protein CRN52_12685 [Vibrio vulnificus]